MNITYLKVILSLITILILIHNEDTYQSHKDHPTNKIRYLISQILILIIYTTLMILIQRYL